MKRFLIPLLAASTLAMAAPAMAQNINARQDTIERRIDMGVRNGALTRNEAVRLRADYRQIVRLENQYRRNGLSTWERRDLNRRLDALSTRIRVERRDRDYRGDRRDGPRGDYRR